MKVFSLPTACPAPRIDFDAPWGSYIEKEEAHREQLKAHLIAMGHTGKHTGGIARFQVADGYAEYMLADGKGRYHSESCLFHLPYGDGYQYQGIEHFPKAEIIQMIEREKHFAALFAKKEPT